MKIINRDITTITEGVIVHQVNTAGVMGAGVAKALADKFPALEQEYSNYVGELRYRYEEEDLLGDVHLFNPVDYYPNLHICNLFGQHLNRTAGDNGRRTSYDATVDGWSEIAAIFEGSTQPFYIPYLMGCGLGGGDWNVYSAIVDAIMGPDRVTACKI